MNTYKHCGRCAITPKTYALETRADGSKHIRKECSVCGQLICHVKNTEKNMELVTIQK